MMKDEGSISDSVNDFSMESGNYDELLVAFKETHDEANRLAVICTKCSPTPLLCLFKTRFIILLMSSSS